MGKVTPERNSSLHMTPVGKCFFSIPQFRFAAQEILTVNCFASILSFPSGISLKAAWTSCNPIWSH